MLPSLDGTAVPTFGPAAGLIQENSERPEKLAVDAQLPGSYYDDDAVFELEMRHIFGRTWQYVGHADAVRSPGDYLTATVGTDPIVVVRGDDGPDDGPDGGLRAFHNVCPHRGARLLDGTGSCGRTIVCPYHAWSFRYDGSVNRVPRQAACFPGLRLGDVGLRPASAAVWRGLVFASPDPHAEPLESYLAGFPEFLDRYPERFEDLREVAVFRFDEPINWKIVVENYVEDYHFGPVHPRTLKVFDFDRVQTLPTGRHTRVLMPYRETAPDGPCKYPWDSSGPSYQGYIFPGTTVQTAKNHVSFFRILPVGARRTVVEIPVLQTAAQRRLHPIDVDELRADVTGDMEEDFVVCRSLQANVRSSRYRFNALALERELGVAHFQRTWRSYLGPLVGAAGGRAEQGRELGGAGERPLAAGAVGAP